MGDASARDIALQIANSHGPSGPNAQYLLNLATFLRNEVHGYCDEHVMELDELVKEIINESETDR